MSMWTHGVSPTNSLRNAAAVQELEALRELVQAQVADVLGNQGHVEQDLVHQHPQRRQDARRSRPEAPFG